MLAGKFTNTKARRFDEKCIYWIGLRGTRYGCDVVELGRWLSHNTNHKLFRFLLRLSKPVAVRTKYQSLNFIFYE